MIHPLCDHFPLIQDIAIFLRNFAHSEECFHPTDYSIFANVLTDHIEEVLYEGSLVTHNRVEKTEHHYYVAFKYTESRGIFDINARKDGCAVSAESAMDFESFKSFVMRLFDAQGCVLDQPPGKVELQEMRPVKNIPSLMDLIKFQKELSKAENTLGLRIKWTTYMVHPYDNYGDMTFSGGLWSDHDGRDPRRLAVSYSYSKGRGLYDIYAWRGHILIVQKSKMNLDSLRGLTFEIFGISKH